MFESNLFSFVLQINRIGLHIKNTNSSDAVTQTLKRNYYETRNKKTYTQFDSTGSIRHFNSSAINIQVVKSHPELHM